MGYDINKAGEILDRLAKHKTSKGCLYINKLADIDKKVLKKLIKESYENGKFGVS